MSLRWRCGLQLCQTESDYDPLPQNRPSNSRKHLAARLPGRHWEIYDHDHSLGCVAIYWLRWATKDLVRFNDYKGHWPEFVNKRLLIPPFEVCSLFGNFVKPVAQFCHVLEKQSKNLRQTRDLLLPKLISGEVNVKQVEAEAVANGV